MKKKRLLSLPRTSSLFSSVHLNFLWPLPQSAGLLPSYLYILQWDGSKSRFWLLRLQYTAHHMFYRYFFPVLRWLLYMIRPGSGKHTWNSHKQMPVYWQAAYAVSLLKSTNLSVTDVAFQVGYENVENFIRTFRKKYGMTPTDYRRTSIASIVL